MARTPELVVWEYMVQELASLPSHQVLTYQFNEAGKRGWELVSYEAGTAVYKRRVSSA